MKCPRMIVKIADIEDRGNWYWHPELGKMRQDAIDKVAPLNIKHYQRRTIEELSKTLGDNKKSNALQKKRFEAGERETLKEYGKHVGLASVAGSAGGLFGGAMLSAPAQLLKIPIKSLRGKPLLPLMAGGGLLAGATIPPVIRALMGKRKIKDPGKYLADEDLVRLKREFSLPYKKGRPHLLNDWIGVSQDDIDGVSPDMIKEVEL